MAKPRRRARPIHRLLGGYARAVFLSYARYRSGDKRSRWCVPGLRSASVITYYLSPKGAEMKKLTLDLSGLQVESFTSTETSSERGTVDARSWATGAFPLDPSCYECHTYGYCGASGAPMNTCQGTCGTRCGTCYDC